MVSPVLREEPRVGAVLKVFYREIAMGEMRIMVGWRPS